MVSLTMLKVHVLGMARRIIPPLELFIVASGAVFSLLYHRAHFPAKSREIHDSLSQGCTHLG